MFHFLFGAPPIDWIFFGAFFAVIALFIALAEISRIHFGWSAEVNRKLVHILTGIFIFFTPFLFHSEKPLCWMAVLFIVINGLGIITGRLKGMHGTQRTSFGTVFYPLTFLLLTLFFWNINPFFVVVPMLILALSDAAAAIVGENLKSPHEFRLGKDKKSLEGSATMFLSAFTIVALSLRFLGPRYALSVSWPFVLWSAFATALISTLLEALSSEGSDNLSAPAGAALVLYFLLHASPAGRIQFAAGLGLGLLVSVCSWLASFLTLSGAVGTFLLAAFIFGTGGWRWTLPILAFFLLSSLLSAAGKTHKQSFSTLFEKSGRRDIGQVLANGTAAAFMLFFHLIRPHPVFYTLYLGALAAVTADTWATEIGVFSKVRPVKISTLRPVPAGTSGGVTLLGLFASIVGAGIIAAAGWLAAPSSGFSPHTPEFWIVVGAGFLASAVDSLIGSVAQAQFRCPKCHKITEKKMHCGALTEWVSGRLWLTNDWVNFFCSASGVVLVFAALKILIR